MHKKTESPRHSECKRGKELEWKEMQGDLLVEPWELGADGGSACDHNWRGLETTRRKQNERHPH